MRLGHDSGPPIRELAKAWSVPAVALLGTIYASGFAFDAVRQHKERISPHHAWQTIVERLPLELRSVQTTSQIGVAIQSELLQLLRDDITNYFKIAALCGNHCGASLVALEGWISKTPAETRKQVAEDLTKMAEAMIATARAAEAASPKETFLAPVGDQLGKLGITLKLYAKALHGVLQAGQVCHVWHLLESFRALDVATHVQASNQSK